MTYKPRFRQGKNRKCWCGSGRKQKNCCGPRPGVQNATNVKSVNPLDSSKPDPLISAQTPVVGVPGEELTIIVIPVFPGQTTNPKPADVLDIPGKFKVQLLLSRPGFHVSQEREYKFIDDIVGTSHVQIAKPVGERRPNDVDHIVIEALSAGQPISFVGVADHLGHLGKLIIERIDANSAAAAETAAFRAVSPFLSEWSLKLDVPLHVEKIQVTNLLTQASQLRVQTPQSEMVPGFGGHKRELSDDFRKFASVYREALNSESPFYRFLCFYKVIESIAYRRSEKAAEAKRLGKTPTRYEEDVPAERIALIPILQRVYPWRKNWNDPLALNQVAPEETLGKRFGAIRDTHLRPIRDGIAHALMRDGEIRVIADQLETVLEVNKWLPFCRVWVRLMLNNEFPAQFELDTNP